MKVTTQPLINNNHNRFNSNSGQTQYAGIIAAQEEVKFKQVNRKPKKSTINTKSKIKTLRPEQDNEELVSITNYDSLSHMQEQSTQERLSEINCSIQNNKKINKTRLKTTAFCNFALTSVLVYFADLDEISTTALLGGHAITLSMFLLLLTRLSHHKNIEKTFLKLTANENLNEVEQKKLNNYFKKLKKHNSNLTDDTIAEMLAMGYDNGKNNSGMINLDYY